MNATLRDVTCKVGETYDSLLWVLDRNVSAQVDWTHYTELNVLGIDKIALRKGQRDYVVRVSARLKDGTLALLGVLPNRPEATVRAFLDSLLSALRLTIQTASCDLYENYLNVMRASLPDTHSVADRFHVTRLYPDAVDTLRIVCTQIKISNVCGSVSYRYPRFFWECPLYSILLKIHRV